MALCEFATITSDKEMVVHGANLANEEDFQWLAETLGVYPSDAMLAALWLPKNERLVLQLFAHLHFKYKGEIPGEVLEIDDSTIPETVRRGPATVMPDAGFIDPVPARWTLIALHAHGENIGNWRLPRCDIWLPQSATVLYQLEHLVARGPSKNRCIEVSYPQYPSETMNKLAELVSSLETSVTRLEEERTNWATRRLSLEYARRVAVLETWQWTNAPPKQAEQATSLERLSALIQAIDELDSAASEASPTLAAEHAAAVALLDFLAPKSVATKSIADALDVLAAQPHAFRSEQAEDLFSFLARAFSVLSASSVAEQFVTDHLVSLLQEMAESLPPELERQFADGFGEQWKSLWEIDWRDALVALRAKGGVDDPSPYAKVLGMKTYYKYGMIVVQAALNQATLPILLARLTDYAKTEAALQPLARSLTSCLLRGLLATGAIHSGAPGQVLFAGQDVTRWFKACARTLGGRPTTTSMVEVARELKALKLEDAAKKVRRFAYASFFFSAVSTLSAYEATWTDTWQSWLKLYGAAISTTGELAKLTQTIALQGLVGTDGATNALETIGKKLAMMSAAISLAVAAEDALATWCYMSPRNKLASAVTTMSATAALIRLLPVLAASARWVRLFGTVGTIMAVVQFVVDIVMLATAHESKKVFEQYLTFAIAEGAFHESTTSAQRIALELAWKNAAAADAFRTLGRLDRRKDPKGSCGARDAIPEGEAPTWFFAYSMGFPAEIIAKLFECDLLDVVGAGIPLGPGYEEGSGQPSPNTPPASQAPRAPGGPLAQ